MKPYASYKPSGVAWLGDVPSHWASKRLKHIGQFRAGAGFPIEEQGQPDNPLPFFKVKDIDGSNQGGVITTADSTVSIETANRLGAKIFPKNSIVFAKVGAALLLNRFRLLGVDACVDNNMMGYMINADEAFPEFMYWAMQRINFSEIVNPGTVPSLNEPLISNLFMAIPPPDEQQAIADYLDAETARIDTLVQEKDELIGLLREAQASAFAATVLRFATAAAGVKCNRFAWLDSLPTSWRIAKVKHLTLSVDQGISPQCESRPPDDGEWGVLKVGCVNTGDFNAMESKALPSDIMPIEHITLLKGDVLISRANTKNLVGRAAMADKDYPRLMLSDKHYRLRLDESECLPQYLVFVLTHSAVRVHIEERATGASASMLNIDRRTIMDLEIPLPPVELQDEIVREVQADREALARLITHTQEEIALLKELRAATIADAVLGRVDVRSLTQKQ